ncbi:MAG: adenylate/guanylate cyclase domain-containing protein, partial [Spirochaetaceae bacterium]
DANGDFPLAFRELGRIGVVGRAEPVTVYEPMFDVEYDARRADLEAFERALAAYYAGAFEEAERGFAALAGRDAPAAAYAERCRQLAADPPEEWNGVWIMTSK